MDEPSTCGEGLASRSTVPRKLGELLAATASLLESHMTALDPADPEAKAELDAYVALVASHREIAERLAGLADQMAGYRGLPMPAHDEAALSTPAALTVFEDFIRSEQEVAALLLRHSQEDRELLG
ncbi:hypothetical protein [Kribbella sp. CA-247076]|uniref:hypothetical protein n=1 Tax=Kribbella sp. CA-247076 TaxID=3239941 RepID=UPI003D93D8C8